MLAHAEEFRRSAPLNAFGLPGLIDMPTAQTLPDAELAETFNHYFLNARNTMSFQMGPRMTGSFRYAKIARYDNKGRQARYDRNFDIHYMLRDEGTWVPALAFGLRDLGGTGVNSAEYIVGTKRFGDNLFITAGMGWGRLGTYNGFKNPLGIFGSNFTKDRATKTGTGKFNIDDWFSGDAALFGGVEYRPTPRLSLRLEYSSDDYPRHQGRNIVNRKSPLNFGVTYRTTPSTDFGLYYIHGSSVGFMVSSTLNPKHPSRGLTTEPAPAPLFDRPDPRTDPQAWSRDWINTPNVQKSVQDGLAERLETEGIILESLLLDADRARIRIRNKRYDQEPQAIGRTARILAGSLPASVETFEIVPVERGIAMSRIVIRRSDLEALEFQPEAAWRSFVRAQRLDGAGTRTDRDIYADGLYPKFTGGLGPYTTSRFFDPDNPLRFELGAELSARAEISPGLYLSAAARKKVFGNLEEVKRPSNSVLPHVRTDFDKYDKASDPSLETLSMEYFFRPGKDLYGRVTAGYFEAMYAGISTEVLWKPVDSRLGLGLEMNYVRQREFKQGFGLRNYKVWTGHASAYYDLGNGLFAQLDVGRYLAKDVGATFRIDREFANGWKIGAFATLTDVPFNKFGEGSFDKGFVVTAPLSWFVGQPQRRTLGTVIRPVTRDGGARVDVRNRLHAVVRDYHDPELSKQWGRFWR